MRNLRKEIKELHEDAVFKNSLSDKLFGAAEMFGNDCIVLYEGVNFIHFNDPKECLAKSKFINFHRKLEEDTYDSCLVGHLMLSPGDIRLVYDKDKLIDTIKKEYMQDKSGLFNGEEDCEESALEHYCYNIIGTYMEGIPAFATILKN